MKTRHMIKMLTFRMRLGFKKMNMVSRVLLTLCKYRL